MKADAPSAFPFGGPDHLPARNWGWFALRGALAVALGIATLLLPGPALFAFALVFAAFAFADGVFLMISGIRGARRQEERWWALILAGLLGVAVGTAFFFFPLLGTLVYTFAAGLLIALWAILSGLLQIVAAFRLRRQIAGEWFLMLAGALAVLFGLALLYLLSSAPALSAVSVAWLLGIYALAAGVSLLLLAVRLRRRGREAAVREAA